MTMKPWFNNLLVIVLSLLVLFLIFLVDDSAPVAMGRPSAAEAALQLTPVADTFVIEGRPDERRTTDRTFWVGYDQNGGFQKQRSLLRFDITENVIPRGSTITAATLTLDLGGWVANEETMAVTVARLPSNNWQENINWNEHLALLPPDPDHQAMTTVTRTLAEYQWDITNMLQKWSNDANRGNAISLLLTGDETSGQHERGFWSKDCSSSECGNAPVLIIQFTPPTPTPTSTLTSTDTPVPTSTPTPIPVELVLDYEVHTATPTTTPKLLIQRGGGATSTPTLVPTVPTNIARLDVRPGDEIVYTVRYAVTTTVDDVKVTNKIPANVTTPESISDNGTQDGDQITWKRSNLPQGDTGAMSYKVVYEPTAVEARIATNPDPPTVAVDEEIRFTAVISETFTGITSYHWAYGDGNSEEGSLAIIRSHPYTETGTFTVTLTVSTDDCYIDATTVVEVTSNAASDNIGMGLRSSDTISLLATTLRTAATQRDLPRCETFEPIVNQGAFMTWQGQGEPLRSNRVILNPTTIFYLPIIRR